MFQSNILIVDDEPHMQDLLKQYIEKLDSKYWCAEDGRKGLQILSQHNIDLAFIDLQMPDINGLALLEEASHLKIITPMIILTGYGTIETTVKAMQKGAVDYLEKPISFGRFARKMHEHLPQNNIWKEMLETLLEQKYGSSL